MRVKDNIKKIIEEAGEDPNREGLLKTPERVSKALNELLSGYKEDINNVINNAFFKVDYKEMVIVKDINFYSMCEHHMLPFFGKVHVAYIPDGVIIGLSKIPRIVDVFAKRLQVQERLTVDISKTIFENLRPKGVGVIIEAQHLCMTSRGVKNDTAVAITSSMLGSFEKDEKIRNEFLSLIKK